MAKVLQVLCIKPFNIQVILLHRDGGAMNTHKRLRKLMQKLGWSEYRLSKECGLSEPILANVFRRNMVPSIDTLDSICAEFGITLLNFFA